MAEPAPTTAADQGASAETGRYAFSILDVFSTRPFGGNQLAVLPDARGLTSAAMQQSAREFNFPETTFVLPPADSQHARRVRIFTPQAEMPFAGHPTVGTACELVRGRHVVRGGSGSTHLILEEEVGLISAVVTADDDVLEAEFTLTTQLEQPPGAPGPEAVAEVLSLTADQVLATWFGGIGVNFTFAELADPAAVDAAVLDHQSWMRHLSAAWGAQVFLFARTADRPFEAHARMFAPAFGIPEDPATGSACGALAAILAHRAANGEALELRVAQGVALGRPSEIRARALTHPDGQTTVTVGGACVHVATGHLELAAEPAVTG